MHVDGVAETQGGECHRADWCVAGHKLGTADAAGTAYFQV